MQGASVLRSEVHGHVALLTMHRPEARNALNGELLGALTAAVADLDADDGVHAIVLTGADPAFCAGVDLRELGSGATDLVLPRSQRGPFPTRTTPLIGAVNGAAVTGGLELTLACDWLIASERARFADTHARVGVMPGWGLTVLLPEAIGLRRAREMSATGNFVDADTALGWGLVNHVVAHDDLLDTALAVAADVASNDRPGVARMLQTYEEGALLAGDEAWALEARVARSWAREQLDPATVAARREAIIARGRSQL